MLFGGIIVQRWPRAVWAHLPAVAWGIFVEFSGSICPLTPLEDYLRERGGGPVYQGDFVAHYLLPLLYPEDLTRTAQLVLGIIALAVNAIVYQRVLRHRHR